MDLTFQVHAKIRKPVAEVFAAIYDPKKLSRYFTTGGASGPLDEGTTVSWDFHDFPGAFPVYVKRVIRNEKIILEWQAAEREYNTRVEITFEALDAQCTLVRITESGWKENDKDLRSSYLNCMGWTQMLCCLKTFVELGVNLREFFY